MSDNPWYVEWGGIFMPWEDALGQGCLLAIVLGAIWVVGVVIYAIAWTINSGIQSLGKRKWVDGIVKLGLGLTPLLLLVLFMSAIVVDMITGGRGEALFADEAYTLTKYGVYAVLLLTPLLSVFVSVRIGKRSLAAISRGEWLKALEISAPLILFGLIVGGSIACAAGAAFLWGRGFS